MKTPFVIIDGYNFLHSVGTRRSLNGPGNLQRAREALAGQLAAWMEDEQRERTTIVFDSNLENRDAADVAQLHGIRVLYARGFDDADSMIEHLLRQHSSPKAVVVVSNDRRVQQSARRRRATSVACTDWFEQLQANARRRPAAEPNELSESDRPDSLSPAERDAWIQAFNTRPPRTS